MKKIITGLLLAAILLTITGCLIVPEEIFDYHDFTFVNNTNDTIADWYLETSTGKNVAINEDWQIVESGRSRTIHNVRKDYYRVRLSYAGNPYLYYSTDYFKLDSNTKYYLRENNFYARSAAAAEQNNTEKHYVLADENGNNYELIQEN